MKTSTIVDLAAKISVTKLVVALCVIALGTIGATLFFVDLTGI